MAVMPSMLQGQIIDNRLGKALQEEMYFNQEFIWTNKVKNITVSHAMKRTGRPIEQRPDLTVFHFNEVGLLRELDKMTSVLDIKDSLIIEYKRNATGDLEQKTENSRKGVYLTQFVYDKEGKVIREDYGKAENISAMKGKVETGPAVGVNSETFVWTELSPGVWKKSLYNNYGLLYAHRTIRKNALGYIESEEEELVMSARITTTTYKYNDRGWVSEIETKDNQGGKTKKSTFTYDRWGNLEKLQRYENTQMIEEVEVLYTETMLVEAILVQDMQTKDIQIQKFAYEFFK